MKGKRNNFFFIYSCLLKKLGWNEKFIESSCMRLNSQLSDPLKESEIIAVVRNKQYHLGNDTIAERLGFTEEEKSI